MRTRKVVHRAHSALYVVSKMSPLRRRPTICTVCVRMRAREWVSDGVSGSGAVFVSTKAWALWLWPLHDISLTKNLVVATHFHTHLMCH